MKTTSTTGTKSTGTDRKEKDATQTLSAKDICSIIKQCRGSGVSEINYLGLSLKFHPRRNEDADSHSNAADPNQGVNDETLPPVVMDERVELMDQQALLEAEEAQMLIDDPAGFEKLQMSRDIERHRVNP